MEHRIELSLGAFTSQQHVFALTLRTSAARSADRYFIFRKVRTFYEIYEIKVFSPLIDGRSIISEYSSTCVPMCVKLISIPRRVASRLIYQSNFAGLRRQGIRKLCAARHRRLAATSGVSIVTIVIGSQFPAQMFTWAASCAFS